MRRTVQGALAGALLALIAAAPAAADPVFVVDPPAFDFGILVGDVSAPFSFTLRNDGSAPIHVAAVDPSCACTSVLLPDSTIRAGEAVPLTGFFSSRKMDGNVIKTIFVDTDDPERPRAVLVLRAWVQRTLTYEPKGIHFPEARTGREAEETVLFRPGEGIDFAIEKVTAPKERYRSEVVAGEMPGDLVLRLVLLPPDAPGEIDDTVFVETNVKGRERIVLPVTGRIGRAREETGTK